MNIGLNTKLEGTAIVYALFAIIFCTVMAQMLFRTCFEIRKTEIDLNKQTLLYDNWMSAISLGLYFAQQDSTLTYTTELNKGIICLKTDARFPYSIQSIRSIVGKDTMQSLIIVGAKYNGSLPALSLLQAERKISLAGNALINGNIAGASELDPQRTFNGAVCNTDFLGSAGHTLPVPLTLLGSFIKSPDELFDRNSNLVQNTSIDFRSESIANVSGEPDQIRLVIANVIRIEGGFKGTLHGIARDSIIVESGADLNYPSSLLLYSDESKNNEPYIRIESGSLIEGGIYAVCKQEPSKLKVFNHGEIQGLLYVKGGVDNQGNITGALVCNYIFYKSPTTMYKNLMFNGGVFSDPGSVSTSWLNSNSYEVLRGI